MITDILTQNRTYNIALAKIIGVTDAIIIQLMLQLDANKKDDAADFRLTNEKISDLTGLTEDEIKAGIENLISLKLISKTGANKYSVELNTVIHLFGELDEDEINTIKIKSNKRAAKLSKEEAIKERCMSRIKTTNEELRKAYSDWIDACTLKQGPMTNGQIDIFQDIIDRFANHNLDIALAVIQPGIINGWRNADYCINFFNANKNKTFSCQCNIPAKEIQEPVKLSSEEF